MLLETLSFDPDKAPHIGGVKDCFGFVPTATGMKTAPALVGTSQSLATACRGIETLQSFDSSLNVTVAGTSTALFADIGAGFVDVSKAGGYTIPSGQEYDWSFATFDRSIFASSIGERLQVYYGSGDFATVADGPQARIIEPVGLFLMAFNDVDDWPHPDGWWCSAERDGEDWTPSVSTQATRGRLYATAGGVLAAKALGPRMVAYKENGIYLGTYEGPPKVFGWDLVPSNQGAVGPNAVAMIYPNGSPAHFVVGPNSMYVFDGSRPVLVGDQEVQKWFYSRMAGGYEVKTTLLVDARNSLVYILYVSTASTNTDVLDGCLVFNYANGRWGVGRDYECTHAFQKFASTFSIRGYTPAVVGSDREIKTLNGDATALDYSYLTTRAYGSDDIKSKVSRVRPRNLVNPSAVFSTMTGTHKFADSLSFQNAQQAEYALLNNRVDFQWVDRWHQDTITVNGSAEFDALSVTISGNSKE